MQASIRVRIFRNSAEQSQGYKLNISSSWTWEDFLSKCAEKLQIPSAQIVFSREGDIIDSLDAMRDNDDLYISQGQHFYPPSMNQEFRPSENYGGPSSSRTDYYRVAVVGPAAVGKSSIVMRYIKGQFPTYYDPTIESNYTRPQKVDGKVVELDILDTAGMEQYEMIKDLSIKDREYFVYVFDINEKQSFDKLGEKYLDYHQSQPRLKGKPVLVVGNKIDKPRSVKKEDAEALAKKFGAEYYETSALTNVGIMNVFERMAVLIKQKVEPADKKKGAKKKVSWFKKYCRIL